MSQDRQTSLTQSVTRALNILKCFSDETPLLRVSDISARLDLTPSLVSRVLITLEHDGFVERDEETGYYRVGKSIIALASVALNHNRLSVEALPEMQAVAAEWGLGVNLSVLDSDTIFYLANCDGRQAPRAYTLVGRRNPLHATGMGKVLLAHLPLDERAACLDRLTLPRYTVHTLGERAVLEPELDRVYAQGWASEIEELALGRGCVASPIRDRMGKVVAALSVSGPLSALRWEERRQELIDLVIETADRISIRLGYITAPGLTVGDWRPVQRDGHRS